MLRVKFYPLANQFTRSMVDVVASPALGGGRIEPFQEAVLVYTGLDSRPRQ